MNCLLVLSLAVFGASASPCLLSGSNSFNFGSSGSLASLSSLGGSSSQIAIASAPAFVSSPSTFTSLPSSFAAVPSSASSGIPATPSCGSALQGPTTYQQTGLIEGANAVLAALPPPTSVSKSCHCLKTFVRPQIRTEVFTVPTVDRLTRIVNNPVVEVVSTNAGGHNRNFEIPTCGASAQTFSAAPVVAVSSMPATQILAAPAMASSSMSLGQVVAAPAEISTPIFERNNLMF